MSHLNITPKWYYGLNLRYLQHFHVFRHKWYPYMIGDDTTFGTVTELAGVSLRRVRKNLKVMPDSGTSPSSVLSDSPRHEKMLPHTCALRMKPCQLLFFPCNDGLYNWNSDSKETRLPLSCFVRYFVTTVRKVMNKDDLKMLAIGERWERML